MSSTPSNPRTFAANTGLGLKTTPSYSTFPKSIRSPNKTRSIYESGLSLKNIIGTTVSSPNGFDSLPSSKIYAYTAGASAVVVNVSDDGKYSQRFYRARPTAIPTNPVNAWNSSPSTPSNVYNDSRSRTLRESSSGLSPAAPFHTHNEHADISKTWTSRERIKAATCLSISRDGNYLAVGETGYSPRVLIFCLQHASSESPLSILSEHTYGVRAVAFNADSSFLASLGSMNDGFLHIWTINPRNGAAKLHSSNKCTNVVKEMVWMGSNIITVGTRHVKVWRVEDGKNTSPIKEKFALDGAPQPTPSQPALKTLSGRNCLLGPQLLDMTFTCVVAVSENKAILCTDKGDICLLDDSEKQRLSRIGLVGFGATCIALDVACSRIRIGGRNGRIKTFDLDELLSRSITPGPNLPSESPSNPSCSVSPGPTSQGHLCAMAVINSQGDVVSVNSKHVIEISTPGDDDTVLTPKAFPFTAHSENVQGVKLLSQPNQKDSVFFTWSTCGTVLFWDLEGQCKASMKIEMEQDNDFPNECRVVRASKDADFFVSGDKYGVLKIMNGDETVVFCVKAHSSEIQDIDIFEGEDSTFVASCGRDRTVQLFKKVTESWVLVQTMDEHTANVCCVSFCENGEKLVSTSTDRTIQVRQLATRIVGGQTHTAAIPVRIITLKASPVSMTIFSNSQSTALTVSLLDRSVATYDLGSGRLTNSFRAIDNETGDAVVMDGLVMGRPSTVQSRPTFLAGVSSTDKSVRVYEGTTGFFLDREWGHTASVTDVALLEDDEKTTLISTGSDGTIMIWGLSARVPDLQEPFESPSVTDGESPPKESASTKQPIRRVLSRAELAEFQRSTPNATPTGRSSPPRTLRKKTSKYALSTPSGKRPPVPPISFSHNSFSESEIKKKMSIRARSRSPPRSPKSREGRRPSLADTRNRTKSTSHLSEFGSLNMSTEQVCRTLRAYRKKLKGSEIVREETMKELDLELRLTAKALGERALKSKALNESAVTDLLDQYSERLVSIFDEKLKISLGVGGTDRSNSIDSGEEVEDSERGRTRSSERVRRTGAATA